VNFLSSQFLLLLKKVEMLFSALAAALLAQQANAAALSVRQGTPPSGCCATAAMLRFQCSQLTIDRIDPLVDPGQVPSSHLHQIVGGNSLNG
jgi:hypothetical protein